MIKDLVINNRSYRRFDRKRTIDIQTLRQLVDMARLSASAANLQPLRYILSSEPQKNDLIYPHLAWAGYLTDWPGPDKNERPTAYIIILGDTRISKFLQYDCSIAAQTILLGATEMGLGGCMLGSIKREQLRNALDIPQQYEILLVVALGKPNETVVIEKADSPKQVKYWRDNEGIHHVPKLSLDDIIIG